MNEFTIGVNTATQIARQQTSGTAAKSLLSPCEWENTANLAAVKAAMIKEKKKNKPRNHQANHRKQLVQMQRNKKRREDAEILRRSSQMKELESMKEKQFGNIKSRVFESKSSSVGSVSTDSTLLSSTGSLSLSSASDVGKGAGAGVDGISDQRLHKSFGRVPEYILKRQIDKDKKENSAISHITKNEQGKEEQEQEQNATLIVSSAKINDEDRKKILKGMKERENQVRKEIMKLPFGNLSNSASLKRDRLKQELKDIEQEKTQLKNQVRRRPSVLKF